MIPLAKPDIDSNDIEAVMAVLKSGRLSLGPKVEEFEAALAKFVGTQFAVACSSGTAALHLGMRGLDIQPGDEIITTPYSFIASANCILFEQGIPKFVDIEQETYNLDPSLIEKAITPKTKGILAVDLFGRLANWKTLQEVADKHDLFLIEDSCEALGTPKAGTFGRFGAFGFYANKQITCGEGGVLVTDDPHIAQRAQSERNQGRSGDQKWLVHDKLGFNYRLTDLSCALLLTQLQKLPRMIEKRRWVAKKYIQSLKGSPIKTPLENGLDELSPFVFVIELPSFFDTEKRQKFIEYLGSREIQSSPYFPVIHLQPFYKNTFGLKSGLCPVAEDVSQRTLALPFFPGISEQQIDQVSQTVLDALNLFQERKG